MTKIMVLSVLMMCATLPSRALPLFFLGERKMPPFVESILHYVPFAVLGSLIFPDVLTATGDIQSSAAGALTALLLGWFGRGPLVVLGGGILAAYVVSML